MRFEFITWHLYNIFVKQKPLLAKILQWVCLAISLFVLFIFVQFPTNEFPLLLFYAYGILPPLSYFLGFLSSNKSLLNFNKFLGYLTICVSVAPLFFIVKGYTDFQTKKATYGPNPFDGLTLAILLLVLLAIIWNIVLSILTVKAITSYQK